MIYKGSTKIKDVYFGSTKIKEIYHGSTLVYSSGGYPSGTILFENATAGTYTLQVDYNCTVSVDLVGGGSCASASRKGASGAYISGTISLSSGTYTIIIGDGGIANDTYDGGNSTFNSNTAGCGIFSSSGGTGGTATVVTTGLTGQNGISNSNVGWINGYGAGGSVASSPSRRTGVAGYCKIEVV